MSEIAGTSREAIMDSTAHRRRMPSRHDYVRVELRLPPDLADDLYTAAHTRHQTLSQTGTDALRAGLRDSVRRSVHQHAGGD